MSESWWWKSLLLTVRLHALICCQLMGAMESAPLPYRTTCFHTLSLRGRQRKLRPSPIGLHVFIYFPYVGEKGKCAPPLSDYMLSYTFTTWASKKSAPLPYRITCVLVSRRTVDGPRKRLVRLSRAVSIMVSWILSNEAAATVAAEYCK